MLASIDAEREALFAAVDAIPAVQRGAVPPGGGWSISEVLEHLLAVEKGIAKLLAMRIAELRASGVTSDDAAAVVPSRRLAATRDRSRRIEAPERIRPRGVLDAEAARSALMASRASLRDTLRGGAGLALSSVTHPHAVLGELDLEQWVLFIGYHEARHADQIREIGAALSSR